MITATIKSGQALCSHPTSPAAMMTATLASASLRLNSQMARAFASPVCRKRMSVTCGGDVYCERGRADPAHEIRFGRHCVQSPPDRRRDHTDSEYRKKPSLRQRHASSGRRRPAKREQADQRYRAVAKKVEGVCFESLTSSQKAADNLHNTEPEIEDHHGPQSAPVRWIACGSCRVAMATTSARLFCIAHFVNNSQRASVLGLIFVCSLEPTLGRAFGTFFLI